MEPHTDDETPRRTAGTTARKLPFPLPFSPHTRLPVSDPTREHHPHRWGVGFRRRVAFSILGPRSLRPAFSVLSPFCARFLVFYGNFRRVTRSAQNTASGCFAHLLAVPTHCRLVTEAHYVEVDEPRAIRRGCAVGRTRRSCVIT